MALGDSNNGSGKKYDPQYFSRLKITDQETKLQLGFRFSSGMLVMMIQRPKAGMDFEYETLNEIYITPTKAKILTQSFDYAKMVNDPDVKAVGVTSGLKEVVSAIAFLKNPDYSIDGPVILPSPFTGVIIGKVDASGNWVSQSQVNFNTGGYHSAIAWSDVQANQFSKVDCDGTEFDMIAMLLKYFSNNMSGGIAYAVADFLRFDFSRTTGRLKPIYEKLGIEWAGSGSSQNTGNNFYNNNTRGGSAEHKDFDAAMDELPFH